MVEKNAIRRAYDELAETYAEQRSESGHDTGVLDEFLGSLSAPTLILDAGCGQGTPVLTRLSSVVTAIGVDFSREQLRLARETARDAFLLQGDMTALPFKDGVFDAVVAYWSLIHVPMDDHQPVIDEFARVLRPGGQVLVCEGTNEWIGDNPDWLGGGVEMQWNIAGAEATRDQLQKAGFTIIDRWLVPESLEEDDDTSEDTEIPWTFFSARIDN